MLTDLCKISDTYINHNNCLGHVNYIDSYYKIYYKVCYKGMK